MLRKTIIASTIVLGLQGCSANDEVTLENELQQNYLISDFRLSSTYKYWEIRINNGSRQDPTDYEVRSRFDVNIFRTLSNDTVTHLENTRSEYGFDAECLPGYCPIYAVAIDDDNDTHILDSKPLLKSFFGQIDTEAELYFWVKYGAGRESGLPIQYETQGNGYDVIIRWDSLCGVRGTRLIHVSTDGETQPIKDLTEESYEGCV